MQIDDADDFVLTVAVENLDVRGTRVHVKDGRVLATNAKGASASDERQCSAFDSDRTRCRLNRGAHRHAVIIGRSHPELGDTQPRNSRFFARATACAPQSPCTPAPGGVEAEQR